MSATSYRLDGAAPCPAGAWLARAGEFSATLVHPLGLVVDRVAPSAPEVQTLIREFVRLADRAGFTTVGEPGNGAAGLPPDSAAHVLTALCEGDAALGALIALCRLPARCVAAARRFDPCGGPPTAVPLPISDREGCVVTHGRGPLRLRREGSGWRLSGATRTAVTAGAIASHAAVGCVCDSTIPRPVVAIVPLNRPGVRRHAAGPAAGQRARAAAALAFDNLWLEPERVLDAAESAVSVGPWLRAADHIVAAMAGLGMARAAHRGATRWRAEHELPPVLALTRLGVQLGDAQSALEALAIRLDHADPAELRRVAAHALVLRRRLAQTAVVACRWAVVACGDSAWSPDGVDHADRTRFHPEKLLRDALVGAATRTSSPRPAARGAVPTTSTRSMSWVM